MYVMIWYDGSMSQVTELTPVVQAALDRAEGTLLRHTPHGFQSSQDGANWENLPDFEKSIFAQDYEPPAEDDDDYDDDDDLPDDDEDNESLSDGEDD